MAANVPFTDNYQDLSTDQGFQFRFHCERCGNGYMSSFQRNSIGTASEVLRAASSLFGGFLGRAADSAYEVQRMVGGPQHDAALRHAVEEISALFQQCPRCGQWVCEQVCWNGERNQCVRCSPKMEHEISAIESEATIIQLRNRAYNDVDLTGGVNLQSSASHPCPACGATVPAGMKFCGDCGANVRSKPHCPSCGAENQGGQKFCGDCGARMSP